MTDAWNASVRGETAWRNDLAASVPPPPIAVSPLPKAAGHGRVHRTDRPGIELRHCDPRPSPNWHGATTRPRPGVDPSPNARATRQRRGMEEPPNEKLPLRIDLNRRVKPPSPP